MDSKEEILMALEEFNRKAGPSDKVPPLLDRYLHQIAATGETLFAWAKLEQLFSLKLDLAMKEFFDKVPTDGLPNCPNVENVTFQDMRERLLKAVSEFSGAPFTIQRLCELITNPQKHYKRTDKFLRGIEKNLLVVSTVDPFGNKIVKENSKSLVNGLEANGYENDKIPDTPDRQFCPPAPTSSPNTNGNHGDNDTGSPWFPGTSNDTVCPWGGASVSSQLPPQSVIAPGGDAPSSSTETLSSSTSTPNPSISTDSHEPVVEKSAPPTPTTEPGPATEPSTTTEPAATTITTTTETVAPTEPSGPMEPAVTTTEPACEVLDMSGSSSDSSETSSTTSSSQSISPTFSEGDTPGTKTESKDPVDSTTATAPSLPPKVTHLPSVESEPAPAVAGEPVSSETPASTSDEHTSTSTSDEPSLAPQAETQRESTKRTIEQNHTETLNKRPRIEDAEATPSVETAQPAVAESTPSDTTTPHKEAKADEPSNCPVNEEQTKTESEVGSSVTGETSTDLPTEEPVAAAIQESRDSDDSLGFETRDLSETDVDTSDSAKQEDIAIDNLLSSSEVTPVSKTDDVKTSEDTPAVITSESTPDTTQVDSTMDSGETPATEEVSKAKSADSTEQCVDSSAEGMDTN